MGTVVKLKPRAKEHEERKARKRQKQKGFRLRQNDSGTYTVEFRNRFGKVELSRTFPLGTTERTAEDWGVEQRKARERAANPDLVNVKDVLKGWTLRRIVTEFVDESLKCTNGFMGTVKLRKRGSLEHMHINIQRALVDHPEMANKPLAGVGCLSQHDFTQYQSRLIKRGCSTGTVNKYTKDLLTAIDIYGREYLNLPIPDYKIEGGKRLRIVREVNKKRKPITEEQYNALCKALELPKHQLNMTMGGCYYHPKREGFKGRLLAPTVEQAYPDKVKRQSLMVNWQWRLIIDWALHTGVRLNGILKTLNRDMDWEHNHYFQRADKTSPERWLPLPVEFMAELWRYKQAVPEQCRAPNHPIFWNTRGINKYEAIDPDAASSYFRVHLAPRAGIVFEEGESKDMQGRDRAGKAATSFHKLRHTAKVRFRRMGFSTDEINFMTGTKVEDRYLDHWDSPDIEKIRDKQDKHWRAKGNIFSHPMRPIQVLQPAIWIENPFVKAIEKSMAEGRLIDGDDSEERAIKGYDRRGNPIYQQDQD
jgi:integrase